MSADIEAVTNLARHAANTAGSRATAVIVAVQFADRDRPVAVHFARTDEANDPVAAHAMAGAVEAAALAVRDNADRARRARQAAARAAAPDPYDINET